MIQREFWTCFLRPSFAFKDMTRVLVFEELSEMFVGFCLFFFICNACTECWKFWFWWIEWVMCKNVIFGYNILDGLVFNCRKKWFFGVQIFGDFFLGTQYTLMNFCATFQFVWNFVQVTALFYRTTNIRMLGYYCLPWINMHSSFSTRKS